MGHPITRMGVVAPVHNEERLLPAMLSALMRAASQCEVPVRIVIVLDACTDRSRRCAEAAARSAPGRVSVDVLQIHARRVGAARRAGAARLLDDGPDGLWIANTDADCRVPPHWLLRQRAYAGAGGDAVAGTIAVDDWSSRPAAVGRAAERAYRSGPHRHVHGANLGVRAASYLRAGGFPPAQAHEDATLVSALQRVGASIVWARDVPVLTSARRGGRAPAGFAAYLDRLERRLAAAPRRGDPQSSSRPGSSRSGSGGGGSPAPGVVGAYGCSG